jgi:hypothetical protein
MLFSLAFGVEPEVRRIYNGVAARRAEKALISIGATPK